MTYAQIWERAASHLGKFARVFYQVTLYCEGSNVSSIHALNLSQEFLESRVLAPYRRGKPITLKGRTIECSNIARICIMETAEEHLQLEDADYYLLQLNGFTYSTSERDVTDELIVGPPGYEVEPSYTVEQDPKPPMSMKVFISHSSRDVVVVEFLIDLLQKALNLKSSDIRCTSVDGYRMPGGASVDATLQAEVHNAELLIGVITPISLKSAYVMFELGARWGAGKRMIPLLASGATPNHLGGPLAGLNALDASQIGQLYQLLEEAAQHLSVDLEKASTYAAAVEELSKEAAKATDYLEEQSTGAAGYVQLSGDAKELLIEATKDPHRMIEKTQSSGGTKVETNGRQFVEKGNMRSEARWEHAIEDLFEKELIDDPKGMGSVFIVAHDGFQLVNKLSNQG